jgi:hypothetical protein
MEMVAQPSTSVYGNGRIETSAIYGNGNDDNEEFQSGRLLKLTWDDAANIWKVRDC